MRGAQSTEGNNTSAGYRRRLAGSDESFETYRPFFEDRSPETLANIAICLLHQANYLLDRQIRRMERDFGEKGGLRGKE
jgi:four helix bundle suffix protein